MSDGLYVYAITPRAGTLPGDLRGLAGDPLQLVVCGDLAAVTSRFDHRDLRPVEQVLAHEQIVEAVRASTPSLPVRFGTILPDLDALTKALGDHYDALSRDLERLGDKAEMAVLFLGDAGSPVDESVLDPASPDADGPGTRYLRAKLAEHRRDEARHERAHSLARELERALHHCILDSRVSTPSARLLKATYLVHHSAVESFRTGFEAWRQAHPDIPTALSGPWPPYTFVAPPETEQKSPGTRPAGVNGQTEPPGDQGSMLELRSGT